MSGFDFNGTVFTGSESIVGRRIVDSPTQIADFETVIVNGQQTQQRVTIEMTFTADFVVRSLTIASANSEIEVYKS